MNLVEKSYSLFTKSLQNFYKWVLTKIAASFNIVVGDNNIDTIDATLQYRDAMTAIHVLEQARQILNAEDGPGVMSPAWKLVLHAQHYLTAFANAVLRGDETFCYRGAIIERQ